MWTENTNWYRTMSTFIFNHTVKVQFSKTQEMSKIVISDDSHFKRIQGYQLASPAVVVARGRLKAHQINFQFLAKQRGYNVSFLCVGGNDISHQEY